MILNNRLSKISRQIEVVERKVDFVKEVGNESIHLLKKQADTHKDFTTQLNVIERVTTETLGITTGIKHIDERARMEIYKTLGNTGFIHVPAIRGGNNDKDICG